MLPDRIKMRFGPEQSASMTAACSQRVLSLFLARCQRESSYIYAIRYYHCATVSDALPEFLCEKTRWQLMAFS